MFRKIFHSTTVGKPGETPKACLVSESSVSEESEIITPGEIPNPERRFFLRRPLRLKPASRENQLSYFRTLDPFDIKLNLKRSNSFSFKSKLDNSVQTTLGLPRSKSVHFADNLTTYHEFKPHFGKDIDEMESAFEEFRKRKQNEPAAESESEESEDSEDEESLETKERDSDELKTQNVAKTYAVKDNTVNFKTSVGDQKISQKTNVADVNTKFKDGIDIAGKYLQSVFEDSTAERQLGKAQSTFGGFDNSDSTDVDLVSEKGRKDGYLYEIYEQLCGLRDIKAKEEAACDPQQLKSEIRCGVADIGDSLSGCRDQLEQSNSEVRKLRYILQQTTQELEVRTILANQTKTLSKTLKQSQESVQDKMDQIKSLTAKIEEIEKDKAIEATIYVSNTKLKAEIEEQLRESRIQVSNLQEELKNVQSLQTTDESSEKEKSELEEQLRQAKKAALDLQAFQEAEKAVLHEEYTREQSRVKALEQEVKENLLVIQEKDAALKTQKAIKDQQLNEASLMINEVGLRYEEKKSQVVKILENLECLRFSQTNNQRLSSSHSGTQERKSSHIEPKFPSPNLELDLESDIITNIQKGIANLMTKHLESSKHLEEVTTSNKIAVEGLTTLIKGSFDILAPILHRDCTEQFQNLYDEFSQNEVLSQQRKCLVTVLSNFVLNSQRELLLQHSKNEQMLETEIKDRLKYQQQVLDSFTKIATKILDRGPRVSGIRGHSSPKKFKSLSRNS
ncbi:hypothetical protein METBIDRAFT_12893 [Metschnikowia bicuspidata var. bicuspidata NRRL YB-4993]|uniref:Uncharacterized protein n=1 Tax=Metschnikowia bicuspidata var. bicuspidata NRRL YB-4993 TaxID=869754 RepID=A0A1A0H7I7_9ASCO|nr:hypothetical protein METBIDRAFT_12893 [Metschnikowia bicuspidata var. bicuspidata NRRL YB-4993]OBA19857.1 hypothetical protein METBIDRAFT_12893 [Metschnikowia bicuspidata var. bicuspidata NRRL YB-4993]